MPRKPLDPLASRGNLLVLEGGLGEMLVGFWATVPGFALTHFPPGTEVKAGVCDRHSPRLFFVAEAGI